MARIIFFWIALTYSGSLFAQVSCVNKTIKSLIGIREQGGNNRGPEVDKLIIKAGGKPGQAWCGWTQRYLLIVCGAKNMGGGMASSWGVASRRVRDVKALDHFTIYNKYIGRIGHVGIVYVTYPEEKFFKSFEGNINAKGDRESVGSIAGCLMREYAACAGFYRWVEK